MAALFLEAKPLAYKSDFNQKSFLFPHRLADHELFSVPRLHKLAETLLAAGGEKTVRWQTSQAPIDAGWKISYDDLSKVGDAISSIQESGSWVLLYSVQRDPEYQVLLDQLMDDICETAGVPRDQASWEDAYIFMASPNSTTPYHIDHEATFLFQIHGERQASVWNGRDRAVLTEREIERYYAGDFSAATYRQEIADRASVYSLTAGNGVHLPVHAPHSFKNGSGSHSVALGIHFCLRQHDRMAGAYQVNHYMRRFGLKPTPPGMSQLRDQIKIGAVGLFSNKNPKTKDELLRSGIKRLTYPLRMLRGPSART